MTTRVSHLLTEFGVDSTDSVKRTIRIARLSINSWDFSIKKNGFCDFINEIGYFFYYRK